MLGWWCVYNTNTEGQGRMWWVHIWGPIWGWRHSRHICSQNKQGLYKLIWRCSVLYRPDMWLCCLGRIVGFRALEEEVAPCGWAWKFCGLVSFLLMMLSLLTSITPPPYNRTFKLRVRINPFFLTLLLPGVSPHNHTHKENTHTHTIKPKQTKQNKNLLKPKEVPKEELQT